MPDIARIHRSTAVLLLMLTSGCGLLQPGGTESYFSTQALGSNRVLVAWHDAQGVSSDLSLYTVDPVSSNQLRLYGAGSFDFASPAVSKNSSGQWVVAFGITDIFVLNAITGSRDRIAGMGSTQMAASFDPAGAPRFAYMDGSAASGFQVLVQNSATSAPTSLSGTASADTSYWTPTWSTDGQWVLFAKVWGDTGSEAELWRVPPSGTGAEKLDITTTELPTYAVFDPNTTQVLVPGDFTSYHLSTGLAGTFDSLRDLPKLLSDLDAMGYEFVGSPLTGATHPGDEVSPLRHTFPMSVQWSTTQSNRLYFDALVATNFGSPPHEVLGVVVFSWIHDSQVLLKHTGPIPLPAQDTRDWTVSLVHPVIVP